MTTLIAECDSLRACHSLDAQLHACRQGGGLTAGDAVDVVEFEEAVRKRTWGFFTSLLTAAQIRLQYHRERFEELHAAEELDAEVVKFTEGARDRMYRLVDEIARQLYFASGALADKQEKDEGHLTEPQKRRFWMESADLFRALSTEIHPHTAHQIVEALYHLLPCSPCEVFLTAVSAITSSSTVGYQHESLAVGDVVKLI